MNASDMEKHVTYVAYLNELDKLRSLADKKDFSEAGDAEFWAQRQAVSKALDTFLDACREESHHEDR